MTVSRPLLLALSTIVLVAACSPPRATGLAEAEKAAIRKVRDASNAAALAKPFDAAAYVRARYSADAVLLPPNESAVAGASSIEAWFKKFPPVSNLTDSVIELDGGGGLAYVRGTYAMTLAVPFGPEVRDTGKYLEIWAKQPDGSWRATRDMFSSDLSAAAPTLLKK
jgi:ketosteroid isomerase-like protein